MKKLLLVGLVAALVMGCASASKKPATAKKQPPPPPKKEAVAAKKETPAPKSVVKKESPIPKPVVKKAEPAPKPVVKKETPAPKPVVKKTEPAPKPAVKKEPAPKKEVVVAKKPAPAPKVALPARKLTVADVITLTKNGATDQQIIQHITKTKSVFQMTMADLEALRAANVSDPVITHMLDTYTQALLREKPARLPADEKLAPMEAGEGTYDYGYQYPYGVLFDDPERRY